MAFFLRRQTWLLWIKITFISEYFLTLIDHVFIKMSVLKCQKQKEVE